MSIPDTNSPHRAVQIVHRYWEALRHGRQMPLRSEIDPRGLEGALEYAFILERVAPQVARFRLAGQHISALAGAEVRGMPVTTLFTAAARDEAARAIEAVFKGPEMIEIALAADRPAACRHLWRSCCCCRCKAISGMSAGPWAVLSVARTRCARRIGSTFPALSRRRSWLVGRLRAERMAGPGPPRGCALSPGARHPWTARARKTVPRRRARACIW